MLSAGFSPLRKVVVFLTYQEDLASQGKERKQYTKRKDSQRRMLRTEVQGAMGHTGGVHGPCHGGSEESKSGKSETFSPQPYYY